MITDSLVDSLTNSIWGLIEFSDTITSSRSKTEPNRNFKDFMRQILEEIREFSYAVDDKQGEPIEHTREKQTEEGLDILFSTLASYNYVGITKEELRISIVTILTKYEARNWL